MKTKKLLHKILIIIFALSIVFSTTQTVRVLALDKTIKIIEAQILNKSEGAQGSITSYDETTVNADLVYNKVGDYVEYQLTLQNETDYDYKIVSIEDNSTSKTIEYDYDEHKDETLVANSNLDLVIKGTYKNSVTTPEERVEQSDLKLTLKFEEIEPEVSPQTGDNIGIYIAVNIISIIGLIIVLAINKKHKEAGALLVVLLVLPVIVKALDLNVVITIKNNIELKDKVLVTLTNGDDEGTQFININTPVQNVPDTNRSGYRFLGWFVGEEQVDITAAISEDVQIEAKYELITYNITYNLDDGEPTGANPNNYNVETDSFTLSNPQKAGFNFAGWTEGNSTALQPTVTVNKGTTGDLNFTAHYSAREDIPYTVIHKYEQLDGSYAEEPEQGQGVYDTAISPETHPRDGYNTPQLQEITLGLETNEVTYTYTLKQATITFNTNGGSIINSISGKYGEAVTAPANPTREGYTFAGWDKQIPTTIPAEDVTINASWSINQYTITFNTNGGTEITAITQDYGTDITAPANPTKEGHTFAGWDKTIPTTMPAEDVTITASWTINQYTITFNTNGGSTIAAITQDYGTNVTAPANPTKEGHTFAGWDKTIPTTMPAENMTITANWTINQYTITFNTNGGTTIAAITQDYGTTVSAPANPTKEGHTFAGWDKQIPTTMPAEDMTINASWTINQYTITFNTNGGSTIAAITQDYGTNVTAPADPTREGHTFAGWDKTIPTTMPAEDVTITAAWTINQYTITFNTNGGTEIAAITQDYGTTVSAPANPTKEGHTFAGWDKTIPTTMPAEDMTITASWTINQYTITFNTNGGTEIAAITQDYGTNVTAPANPTKEGHTFAGWDKTIPTTMPAENITITASWTINQYTITFNTNGGTTISPITQDYGTDITAPANPTKEGHTFDGWDKQIPTTMPAEDMTINASWTINQYTITFNTNGGTTISPITQDYGTNVTAPANPTKEGHTFAGWDKTIPTTMPAENITITASWTINQYTITFNTNGGTTISPITQDYGTDITAPANPTKNGYDFAGWDKTIPTTMPAENTTITASWTPTTYTITYDLADGTVNPANPDTYTIESAAITLVQPTKEGHDFAGWTGTGLTAATKEVEIPTGSTGNRTYTATWTPKEFQITFYPQGGSEVTPITKTYGQTLTVSELPDSIKKHNALTGWYTDPDTGEKLESDITITSNKDYYAHWESVLLCKKATMLHADTCTRSSGGCYEHGYYAAGEMKTSTIVYGNIPGTVSKKGDAYDCDINNDGVYNPVNERFYYVGTNDNNAVLIFYSNYEGENGIQTINNFPYNEALQMLPTFDDWPNLDFDFEGKAARFLTITEAEDICEAPADGTTKIKNCEFALENTSFRINDLNVVRSGIWLHSEGEDVYRIHSYALTIFHNNTSLNVARPVIEVQMNLMDVEDYGTYTLTFDSDNGTFSESNSDTYDLVVPKGDVVRKLPTPTKEDSVFVGWYKDDELTEEVTLPVFVTDNTTFYAKWEVDNDFAAEINGVRKKTLQAAIDLADTNATGPTTITLLKNITEGVTINDGRHIDLDLGTFTITNPGGTTAAISVNNGTLEISNGTVTSTSKVAAINLEQDGIALISGGRIENTSNRQAIYNNGGTVYITGTADISSLSSERAAVHNKNSGVMEITGGTIVSPNYYAIYNESGTLTIGEKDSTISTTTPVIRGANYGVVAHNSFKFYDGIVQGETYPIAIATTGNTPTLTTDTNHTKVSEIEDDSHIVVNTQTVGSTDYATMFLAETGKYRITLNPNGGSVSPTFVMVTPNSAVGELPTPTNGVKVFRGWYKTEQLNDADLVDETTIPTGDTTYFAKWEDAASVDYICRRVSNENGLHKETCDSTGTCVNLSQYDADDIIRYGNIVDPDEGLRAGDALDCDVNGNGVFDPATERFYYLTDNGNNAVLISSRNFEGDAGQPEPTVAQYTSFNYAAALTKLPSTTQWSNTTATFDNDRAARFIKLDELKTACDTTTPTNGGALDKCQYILENSTFAASSPGRNGMWIQYEGVAYYRIHTGNRRLESKTEASENVVRPVIEIDKDLIDLEFAGENNIIFDANGGTVLPLLIGVQDGAKIDEMPTPTLDDHVFVGWFTEETGGTQVTEDTVINKSMTLYAHWLKNVSLANVNQNDIIIKTNGTSQVAVGADSELEEYTFASSDTSVATVNATTGVITPASEGGTVVSVVGTKSNLTRDINVYVTNKNVVTFDPTNDPMQVYYANIDTWKEDSTNFETTMRANFNNYNCKCADNTCTGGSVNCDKPDGYDTGVTGAVNVYLYDLGTNTDIEQVDYAKGTNGTIYNLIPNKVYRWESASNSSQEGYVIFTGERRIIDAGDVLNVRDLGGMPVDTNDDGIVDGTLKYEKFFRGIKLSSANSVTELENLNISQELDLRSPSDKDANTLPNFKNIQIQNYIVSPNDPNELTYYNWTRNAVRQSMLDVINGESIYFHCRIGTDRTGTLGYILEGLLGVPEEDRVKDYELSFFSGLVNRHRYYATQPNSSVSTNRRFVYLHEMMPTNSDIYDWYMAGTTDKEEDDLLIKNFRTAMIDK